MDIPNLQAFVVVAETGSFSLAAERLYLTQPAISKRVSQLESELSLRLFDRIGRQVSLTEAGLALLGRARSILEQLEDARRELTNLDQQVRGPLVVGTSHHIALHRLAPSLRSFTQDYPQVDLDIRFMDSEAICDKVEHGELELGVVTLPDHSVAALETVPVWQDELVIVCAESHPLHLITSPSELSEVFRHRAILTGPNTFTRSIIERALQIKEGDIQVRISTNNLETIKVLIETGLGWGVLPKTMVGPNLHRIATAMPPIYRPLGIVFNRARTLSNAGTAMIKMIQSFGSN